MPTSPFRVTTPMERVALNRRADQDGDCQNQAEGFEGGKATHRFKGGLSVYNEAVGTSKSSIAGRRWPGTAAWMPPVFADGTPVSRVHPPEDWPFQLVSSKSVLVSADMIGATRLRHLHPENPVAGTAVRQGIPARLERVVAA